MWPFVKKQDFYKMLLNQARKMEEGFGALLDFIRNPSKETEGRVMLLEKEADDLRRKLVDALNRSFVTPIDREDIFALSRAIDDMIDYAKSTVEEMMLFQVKANGQLEEMISALHRAGQGIAAAVQLMKNNPQQANDYLMKVKKTENFVEHRYREALVELFKNPNMVEILKTREIYRHLSNAADRGDEAADIISDILVKTA